MEYHERPNLPSASPPRTPATTRTGSLDRSPGSGSRREGRLGPAESALLHPSAGTASSALGDHHLALRGTGQASWDESQQSLDMGHDGNDQRPSSRRDRAKHLDATTPTLIDEDDYPGEYLMKEEGHAMRSDDAVHRRTPGASMYRSLVEEQHRRTPGADHSQQSSTFAAHKQETGTTPPLGFGLALTTPVGASQQQQQSSSSSTQWRQPRTTFSPALLRLTEDIDNLLISPFSSAPGTNKELISTAKATDQASLTLSSTRARLAEDVVNLLNEDEDEDEDDEYTMEIPIFSTAYSSSSPASLKRFTSASATRDRDDGVKDNWSGPFAVERNSSLVRRTDEKGDIMDPPRPRRQVGESFADHQAPGKQQFSTHFRRAQQPIPRRGSNEVFEFGIHRVTQSDTPQQLFHLGGAFAPPAKDVSASVSRGFSFPTSNVDNLNMQPTGHLPQLEAVSQTVATMERDDPYAYPSHHLTQSSQSFDTFSTQRETPIEVYFHQSQVSSPSPHPSPAQPRPPSDMVATAQEYVPRNAQSVTPQLPLQMWSQPSPVSSLPTPLPYDAALQHIPSWHPSPPGFGTMYSSSFGESRSVMTPSPHIPMFHQRYPNVYHGTHANQGVYVAPIPTHQPNQYSRDYRAASSRKDNKRGKKSKKKTNKDKGQGAGSPFDQSSTKIQPKSKKSTDVVTGGTISTQAQNEDAPSASEDPTATRRGELDESPAVRLAFKTFYKAYRLEEQKGVGYAEEFAKKALQGEVLPPSIHWRIYIELADLARRTNRFAEARRYFQKVCKLQPYASQGWVEYSKLEEECGNMNRVSNIMYAGLEYCEYNENLMIRAIKHQEKLGKYANVRALLARLKHMGVEKVWRTVLEGALFEARVGNVAIARRALEYVCHYVPWYGPLYVEFYRLERDHGQILDALDVVERGLAQIPRYSPLWFSALRICEELDHFDLNFELPRTTAMLERASAHVSKEVIWKVYLEAAFLFERAAVEKSEHLGIPLNRLLSTARYYFALTIQTCRLNLRWKVWLAGARMELSAGNKSLAVRLFTRAHEVAPEKVRSLTLLDYARLHEYIGERDLARAILCKGRAAYGHDWKVWLESILVETRGQNTIRAFEIASSALEVHGGTGRLWSALVQLSQFVGGDSVQYSAFRKALNAVPKSGEVWCEGARIHFNPFSDVFDVDRARRHLFFAERFTPQYGDSFLESVRLELVCQWLLPIAKFIWEKTKSIFRPAKGGEQRECLTKYITDVSLAVSLARQPIGAQQDNFPSLTHGDIVEPVRERLLARSSTELFDLKDIFLACSNADPNYGPLWFYFRRVQTDAPRRVIERAASAMLAEIHSFAHIYVAAQVRRYAILSTFEDEFQRSYEATSSLELFDPVAMVQEERADMLLRSYPSLHEIYNPVDPTSDFELLGGTINGRDFATGLMEFNKSVALESMSAAERRRTIFATDALFP